VICWESIKLAQNGIRWPTVKASEVYGSRKSRLNLRAIRLSASQGSSAPWSGNNFVSCRIITSQDSQLWMHHISRTYLYPFNRPRGLGNQHPRSQQCLQVGRSMWHWHFGRNSWQNCPICMKSSLSTRVRKIVLKQFSMQNYVWLLLHTESVVSRFSSGSQNTNT
jgi:hypothetical protein